LIYREREKRWNSASFRNQLDYALKVDCVVD